MPAFDWDAARFFLAARREGSFAAAARKLKVKHTTVSRRIEALERALGAKLFRRTPDGLIATAAGEAARRQAEEMERAAQQLSVSLGEDDEVAGAVRLAIPEAFTELVVGSLGALRSAWPLLVVEVLVNDARADLLRDEADLAIRMGPLNEQSLVCTRLASFGWAVFASAAYVEGRAPLPWAKLDGREVIGFEATLAHAPGAKWLAAHAGGARVALRCNSLIAARQAAVVGLGVAALPCFLGDATGGLLRVTPEVIGSRDAYLVLHRDRQSTPRVRAVAAHLRRHVSAHQALLAGG